MALPDLESLLVRLRTQGLAVGVTEVLRLHRVFEHKGGSSSYDAIDRRGLESLLAAVILKSEEHRPILRRAIEDWIREADLALGSDGEAQPPSAPPMQPTQPGSKLSRDAYRRWLAIVVSAIVVGLVATIFIRQILKPPPPVSQPRVGMSAQSIRALSLTDTVPATPVVGPRVLRWDALPQLVIGLASLVLGATLWVIMRRRSWLPVPSPPPLVAGPSRLFLPPPVLTGPQLLSARQRELIIWGSSQYFTEEALPQINLPATVEATAQAAGAPRIVYRRAQQLREIWLWVDKSARDPAVKRFAEEVESTLALHGMPVERAIFHGLPDRLCSDDEKTFAPREIDERRDVALVAIFTDGRLLEELYGSHHFRPRIHALLRDLSRWPRVAFVDFSAASPSPSPLQAIVVRHDLDVVTPQNLPSFFQQLHSTSEEAQPFSRPGDYEAWAAACALSPASIDEATAFKLLKSLKLSCSPFAISALSHEAPGSPGRMQWPNAVRVRRVNWLLSAERGAPIPAVVHSDNDGSDMPPVVDEALFYRALVFWEEQFASGARSRETASGLISWRNTLAEQHLRMERALLGLFRPNPAEAIHELYVLGAGPWREEIRQNLAMLTARGREVADDCIELPWDWDSLSAQERVMLDRLGFGRVPGWLSLRRPGRLWLGLALCAGLGAGMIVAAVRSPARPSTGPPAMISLGVVPKTAIESMERRPDGLWTATVGIPGRLASVVCPAGASVQVSYDVKTSPCVESLGAAVEIWRCGRKARSALALDQGIGHSAAWVATELPHESEAEELALDLLDSGSAHVVLVGPLDSASSAIPRIAGFEGRLSSKEQLVVLTLSRPTRLELPKGRHVVVIGPSWKALREGLDFKGVRTAEGTWRDSRFLARSEKQVRVRGLRE